MPWMYCDSWGGFGFAWELGWLLVGRLRLILLLDNGIESRNGVWEEVDRGLISGTRMLDAG